MFSRNVFRSALMVNCLAVTLASTAADWPQWRGPLQTAHVPPGEPVPATLPSPPTKLWSVKVGEGFSSPVVAGGRVSCIEAATGKQAWSQEGYFRSGAGKAHASFLVLGNNILVSTDSGELVLMAADAQAFREIGRAQVCGATWSSPAYADSKLYVRDGVSAAGALMCFDLRR